MRVLVILSAELLVGAFVYYWRADARQAVQRRAEIWERGWPGHDVVAISALYAEDAFLAVAAVPRSGARLRGPRGCGGIISGNPVRPTDCRW